MRGIKQESHQAGQDPNKKESKQNRQQDYFPEKVWRRYSRILKTIFDSCCATQIPSNNRIL